MNNQEVFEIDKMSQQQDDTENPLFNVKQEPHFDLEVSDEHELGNSYENTIKLKDSKPSFDALQAGLCVASEDKSICRLCAKELNNKESMHSENNVFSNNYPEKIFRCTSLKVIEGDGFPRRICSECIANLKSAYEFRNICIQTYKLMTDCTFNNSLDINSANRLQFTEKVYAEPFSTDIVFKNDYERAKKARLEANAKKNKQKAPIVKNIKQETSLCLSQSTETSNDCYAKTEIFFDQNIIEDNGYVHVKMESQTEAKHESYSGFCDDINTTGFGNDNSFSNTDNHQNESSNPLSTQNIINKAKNDFALHMKEGRQNTMAVHASNSGTDSSIIRPRALTSTERSALYYQRQKQSKQNSSLSTVQQTVAAKKMRLYRQRQREKAVNASNSSTDCSIIRPRALTSTERSKLHYQRQKQSKQNSSLSIKEHDVSESHNLRTNADTTIMNNGGCHNNTESKTGVKIDNALRSCNDIDSTVFDNEISHSDNHRTGLKVECEEMEAGKPMFTLTYLTKWHSNIDMAKKDIAKYIMDGGTEVLCPFCPCVFDVEMEYSQLLEHLDSHIHTRSTYVCRYENCRESFKSPHARNIHQRTDHGTQKLVGRTLFCDHCAKIVKPLTYWKRHKRDRGESKGVDINYRCDMCAYQNKFKFNLIKHIQAVHNLNRVQCRLCQMTMPQNKIHYHMDNKHKPKIPCGYCNKEFLQRNIKGHLRTHTGEKPFSCADCGLEFTFRVSLKVHRKRYHGDDML